MLSVWKIEENKKCNMIAILHLREVIKQTYLEIYSYSSIFISNLAVHLIVFNDIWFRRLTCFW
jgi:hypothetical protein